MTPGTQGRTPHISGKCVPTKNGHHATNSASRVPPVTKRDHRGASPEKDARVPSSRKGCVPASPFYRRDAGRATGYRTPPHTPTNTGDCVPCLGGSPLQDDAHTGEGH